MDEAGTEEAGIYARESAVLDRWVQVGIAGGRVISVSFPADPDEEAERGADLDLLDRIESYLRGEPEDFREVTVALTLPTDQRQVLEALRRTPYGETIRVERLTELTPGLDPEEPVDRDLVREALRSNPAPLLVPDHRVEDASGATPEEVASRLRSIEGGKR